MIWRSRRRGLFRPIDLYAVSVQNEPDYAHDWTYWSASDCATFMANYGKAVTAGTNAKLMSPESFQYRKDIYNAILNNSQAFENCGLFGTHFYGTQRSQMDFPALENCGKDIWMTEVYTDSKNDADVWPMALDVSENIHNGLTVPAVYGCQGRLVPGKRSGLQECKVHYREGILRIRKHHQGLHRQCIRHSCILH